MRTWTATNGSKMEAAFVQYAEPNVQLQKRDGTILYINRDNLSDEDWVYVMKYDKAIFSFWVKLGEIPARRPDGPLMKGGLPPPASPLAFYITNDGKMKLEQHRSTGPVSVEFPLDESLFKIGYLYRDGRRRVVKIGYYSKGKYTGSGYYSGTAKGPYIYIWEERRAPYKVLHLDPNWKTRVPLAENNGMNYADPSDWSNTVTDWVRYLAKGKNVGTLAFMIGDTSVIEQAMANREALFEKIPRYKRIMTKIHAPIKSTADNGMDLSRVKNLGSGFFVTDNGYFVTCHQTVSGKQQVWVVVNQQKTKAKVVRIDPEHNLALLKLEDATCSSVPLCENPSLLPDQKVSTIEFSDPKNEGLYARVVERSVLRNPSDSSDNNSVRLEFEATPSSLGCPVINLQGVLVGVVTENNPVKIDRWNSHSSTPPSCSAVKSKVLIEFLREFPDCFQRLNVVNDNTNSSNQNMQFDKKNYCGIVLVVE